MSRPYHYKTVHHLTDPDGKEYSTLGAPVFYAIRYQDQLITLQETYGMKATFRKYKPLYGSNRKVLENQCDRLNDIYDTDQYEVVEVRAEMLSQ